MKKKLLVMLMSGAMAVGTLAGATTVMADNLSDSEALFEAALEEQKTTDGKPLLGEGNIFEVPEAAGTPEELEALDDGDPNKWHYYEYLDWDTSLDAEFPASPADGQKGKHIAVILHGAHAWTTCYQEAFQQACDALGMTVDFYDPNWDQSTQDGYIDQAINSQPDAIVVIPVSADHAGQQFKKITDAGIPAFCSNTFPTSDAMNYVMAYTGPNDWYQMRTLTRSLGESLEGKGGVAYITHNVGTSTYYARTMGPYSTIASEFPEMTNLDIQSPGFEAVAVKQVVSDWITKYGDELNAIVLADDSDQAVGAAEACEAAGRTDIKIVAAGNSQQGTDLVKAGKIQGMSYQSCQGDAGLAARTVAEYFNGKEIPRVQFLATDVITAENVAEFEPCQW